MRFPHWIDGHACDPAGDRWLDVFDPAIGEVVARVASGDSRDVDTAAPGELEGNRPGRHKGKAG
jgi:acyl-CoA reductase-like NAD-dependent aldehyde dehydrogenase